MASLKLSLQDKKNIEKDITRLIQKFIQVVLQSRNGNKANYPSKLFAKQTDWFSLSIPDIPGITAETKNAFGRQPVDMSRPICIEISLKTTEDETMILEYWWIVNTSKMTHTELGYRASSPVYSYIETLLRSLLIATRSTPAYRLARNQSSSSYCIRHRILFREPEYHAEDEFKKHVVAVVPSPLGDLSLFVAYKTKLLMYPRKIADLTDIKDDYFNADVIPMVQKKTSSDFMHLFADQNSVSMQGPVSNITPHDIDQKLKKAAFGPHLLNDISHDVTDDIPFSSLLQLGRASPINSRRKRCDSEDSKTDGKPDDGIEIIVGPGMQQSGDSLQSISSATSAKEVVTKDDFVLIDLKPPFAALDEDLSQLFQKMVDIPSLSIFEEPVGYTETVNYLEDQLAHFEAMGTEFNDFVNSIQAPDY